MNQFQFHLEFNLRVLFQLTMNHIGPRTLLSACSSLQTDARARAVGRTSKWDGRSVRPSASVSFAFVLLGVQSAYIFLAAAAAAAAASSRLQRRFPECLADSVNCDKNILKRKRFLISFIRCRKNPYSHV